MAIILHVLDGLAYAHEVELSGVPLKDGIPVKLARVIDEALVDDPEIQIKSASGLKRLLKDA